LTRTSTSDASISSSCSWVGQLHHSKVSQAAANNQAVPPKIRAQQASAAVVCCPVQLPHPLLLLLLITILLCWLGLWSRSSYRAHTHGPGRQLELSPCCSSSHTPSCMYAAPSNSSSGRHAGLCRASLRLQRAGCCCWGWWHSARAQHSSWQLPANELRPGIQDVQQQLLAPLLLLLRLL
jgi:hypothetical protein